VDGEESGQAYITIGCSGENEIHTFFGANLCLTRQSLLDSDRISIIKEAEVAVIMDPPLETAESLAELSSKYGSVVIWDPGVYADLGFEALSSTLEHVDYFILNELEFENFLGTSDPSEVSKILITDFTDIKSIIKRGSQGCIICGSGFDEPLSVAAVPLEKLNMRVVNSVGCGDAFIGAFLASIDQSLPLETAMKNGALISSQALENFGVLHLIEEN